MAAIPVESKDSHQSETYWVSPLKPVEPASVILPAGDQVGVTIIQPTIICALTTDEFDEARFVEACKVATAAMVWEAPVLAGQVVWEDEARHRIKYVIPEDPKVRVTVTHFPELDARELDSKSWPLRTFNVKDFTFSERTMYGIGTINFGIQANILKGGVTITMLLNHTILDGSAQGTVECIWGMHLGRALDGKSPKLSGMLPPEALDKSTAYGSRPARPMLEWKDWKEAPKHNLTPQQIGALIRQRSTMLSITTWRASANNLQKLRASMQQPGGSKMSMATCVSIMIWQTITRARGLDPEDETTLFMPVQTRGRVEGVHPNFLGCALVYGRTKVKVKELLTLSPAELGQRVEQSVAFWTPERIREFWGSIEEADDLAKYRPNQNKDFGPDVEVSNISNMPFFQIPWGKGLNVRAYRTANTPFSDGWVVVMPRLPDGSQEFNVWMQKEHVAAISADPVWRAFANYQGASDPALDAVEAEHRPRVRAKL